MPPIVTAAFANDLQPASDAHCRLIARWSNCAAHAELMRRCCLASRQLAVTRAAPIVAGRSVSERL